jgi:N-dimethylarginine dimethylaminohydrolase
MKNLLEYPSYEPNKPPQWHRYHAEVSYLEELEKIWGRKWGAQGIGKLREVAVVRPTEVEVLPLYDQDPNFFLMHTEKPNLEIMQEQHDNLVSLYKKEGIQVRYMDFPSQPRGPYGPLKRSISAAAGFVINGGAIIPREATPYWRGRSKYVAEFLMGQGCPILYTVHGYGVCEVGAFTRMTDDFIIGMLSPDCNDEGLEQVTPVLKRSGYKEILVNHAPGLLNDYYPDIVGWIHADMFIAPVDARLALIYPPWCDYGVIRRLMDLGYKLIEVPQEEQMTCFVCNALTLEPRRVMVIKGCPRTVRALRDEGVEVIEVPYDEVMKYGGGIRCTTMQLIRDEGPRLFD